MYRIEIGQFPRGNSIIPTTAEILRSLIDRSHRRDKSAAVKTNTELKRMKCAELNFFPFVTFSPSIFVAAILGVKRVFSLDAG